MTDLARGLGPLACASARSNWGSVRPSKPRPPTVSIWRRERGAAWKPPQAEEAVRLFMVLIALARTRAEAKLDLKFLHLCRTNSFAFSSAQVRSSSAARLSGDRSSRGNAWLVSLADGGRLRAVQ